MRIGFYVSSFPATSETFIHRQIAGLAALGHEVTVIAERRAAGAVAHASLESCGILENTTYLADIPLRGPFALAKLCARAMLKAVTSPAAFIRRLGLLTRASRGDVRRRLALIASPAGRLSFDVIVAHFGPRAVDAMDLVSAGMLSGPIIPVFHGFDLSKQVRSGSIGRYSDVFRTAPFCIAISDRWRDKLVELGCALPKVKVVRVGLDTDQFPYVPRPVSDAPKLLSVARLVEKKGIEFGIRAFALLPREMGATYSIVGSGPLLDSLRLLADELGVSDRVSFLGSLPEQTVKEMMLRSDVLLAPSVTASNGDEEGIPVVIMEAMAVGTPVVSTFHSGIPELVIDGTTGHLTRERDVGQLADKLLHTLRDGPWKTSMTEAARDCVHALHGARERNLEIEALLLAADAMHSSIALDTENEGLL